VNGFTHDDEPTVDARGPRFFRMNRREALDNQRLAAGVGPMPWRGVHSDVHVSDTWRHIEGGRAEHRMPSAGFQIGIG